MAVDSRNKRASAINILPHTIYPVPDGTIDDLDRIQATWLYSGIAVGEAVPPPPAAPPEQFPDTAAAGITGARRRPLPGIIIPGRPLWPEDEEEFLILM